MIDLPFFAQIILALLLIGLILLQGRGAGLGASFGGGGETFKTRRGVEKIVFGATIVVAVLFALSLIISLLL